MTEFPAFAEAPHISASVIPATYPALTECCFAFISSPEPPQPGIQPWNFFPPSLYGFIYLSINLFIFVIALLFTYHIIHPIKVYNSMIFSIFKELCRDHHNQF